MIRRDWLQSMVDVLTQALGAALGLKKKGDIQTAAATMEGSIQKAFGMNPKLALGLPLKEFISLGCRGDKPPAEVLLSLSKVFGEWAGLLQAQGRRGEAAMALVRAEELLQLANAKSSP